MPNRLIISMTTTTRKDDSSEIGFKNADKYDEEAQQLEQIEIGERETVSPDEDRRILRKIDL